MKNPRLQKLFARQLRLFDYPPPTPARPGPVKQLEASLDAARTPYVEVTVARGAIFATHLETDGFDLLIYTAAGPNLLTMVRAGWQDVTEKETANLEEWAKVFGPDFAPAIVVDGRAAMLADWKRHGQAAAVPVQQLV